MTTTKNNNKNEFVGNLLKLAANFITILVTVIFTMIGFWLMEGREFVTRIEVTEIIQQENKLILQKMAERDKNDKRLEAVLEKNTEAIQELKVQIATLNRTLEYLEKKNISTIP